MAGVIICGPAAGKRKKLRCPCCGMESDNIEAFATSMCWQCAFAANLDCKRCIEVGVFINHFQAPKAKGHRAVRWEKGKRHIVAACGFRIPKGEIGQASAAGLPECKRCWPDDQIRRF